MFTLQGTSFKFKKKKIVNDNDLEFNLNYYNKILISNKTISN